MGMIQSLKELIVTEGSVTLGHKKDPPYDLNDLKELG
jgi:hypothetical protein